MEITCATSSRRVLLDLFASQDTRPALVPAQVALACQRFLLASRGAAAVDPPAPTPPPVKGTGDAESAHGATAMALTGAGPADDTQGQTPPAPALDPVTVAKAGAISQLRAASSHQDKPHVVVLAGASAPGPWGLGRHGPATSCRPWRDHRLHPGGFTLTSSAHTSPLKPATRRRFKSSFWLSPVKASPSSQTCWL